MCDGRNEKKTEFRDDNVQHAHAHVNDDRPEVIRLDCVTAIVLHFTYTVIELVV